MSLERATRLDAHTRTGLGWLVGARLLLAGLSLGLAVTLDRIAVDQSNSGIWGVYWTIIVAFMATIVSARMVASTANPARFATLQVGIDLAIVTSLVYFSGAGSSVFTFLYAIVVLYGALVLDRNGVGVSAGMAALGYGVVLFGTELGWLPSMSGENAGRPLVILGAYWGFYAGALLVLGMLANTLSAELRRTGAALDRRTTDLRMLRDLHLRTVESLESGLLTTDDEGRVTSFNPEAVRITGLTAADAAGRELDGIIPGASALIERGRANRLEDRVNRSDRLAYCNHRGEDLYLGLSASSLRNESGDQLGHVVIFQDVTRVVSMEQELRQSERLAAVGEMAARIAHEIRNPLASISGSVQVLQSTPEDTGEEGERGRLMGIVVREVDRLNGLITDFLRYSRPAPTCLSSVCLADLVEEVADVNESGVNLDIDTQLELDPSVVVEADADQLKSVIWNLWNNACEAMGHKGRLKVRVAWEAGDAAQAAYGMDRKESLESRRAVLEVLDSGPGVADDARDTIFEPFFTTKRDGTGLGLATVQRLVEQHGGAIQLEDGPDGGTCFRVILCETPGMELA